MADNEREKKKKMVKTFNKSLLGVKLPNLMR